MYCMHISSCKKRAAVKKQKGKVGLTRVFDQVKIRCGFQCTLDRGSWVTLYMLARLINKATLDSQFLDNIDMAET